MLKHFILCSNCHWTDFGQEAGDRVWVAHVDVVDRSCSSHKRQAPLEQAANSGGPFLLHLEQTDRKRLFVSLAIF